MSLASGFVTIGGEEKKNDIPLAVPGPLKKMEALGLLLLPIRRRCVQRASDADLICSDYVQTAELDLLSVPGDFTTPATQTPTLKPSYLHNH